MTLRSHEAIDNTRAKDPVSGRDIDVEWWGLGGVRFITRIKRGKGWGRIYKEVPIEHVIGAANLLAAGSMPYTVFSVDVPSGRFSRRIEICVPRKLVLALADTLRDYHDYNDARHRFWHFEHPRDPKPCSSCRETILAEEDAAVVARDYFLAKWASILGVDCTRIEELLDEYRQLPRKPSR